MQPELVIPVTNPAAISQEKQPTPQLKASSSQETEESGDSNPEPPIHSYAKAADTTYVPPCILHSPTDPRGVHLQSPFYRAVSE